MITILDIKKKTIDELYELCEEIRERIIDVVSKNGGHLSSNLGVVELTVALHYVFNSPEDIILWDIGHQSYIHKILTGRDEKLHTIRKKGGLYPFSNPRESKHDHFIAGHAGNALSAGYGIAEANRDKKVIVVLGDASLSNGISLEAINNIGGASKNMIIIINDNEMSIGENVGALSKNLSNAMSSKFYNNLKFDVEKSLRRGIIGNKIANIIRRVEHAVRYFFHPGALFETLGFNYRGPIDGHNIQKLINVLKDTDKIKEPIVIHVKTQKGKGFKYAEKNKEKFHGIAPFDIETGEVTKGSCNSYSEVFGKKLCELAEQNENIIAITAAMINGTGLQSFFNRFSDRSYDVGIAEEHAVIFAGGLAIKGKKPVVSIYSTFLQRAYDPLIHDIAIQNLPVVFIVDRAGIVGEDGETHQGVFDISYISGIPNFTVTAPACKYDLEMLLEYSIKESKGPVSIRIPRDIAYNIDKTYSIQYGKWIELYKGEDMIILATGSMVKEILEIRDKLLENGINPTIVSAIFIKPLDYEYIAKNIVNKSKYKRIITLEEGILKGGFGSMLLEYLNDINLNMNIERIGIEDNFVEQGKRVEIMDEIGLRGDKLTARILGRRE